MMILVTTKNFNVEVLATQQNDCYKVATVEANTYYIALEELRKANAYKLIDYTEEDVMLLAQVMYAEVGIFLQTQTEEDAKRAHILTGSVVINRVRTGIWGDTIKDVIYAPGQYQCVDDGNINNEPPEEVIKWAEILLEYGPEGPDDMIFQSQFEQGTSTYDKIGNTYFCCKDGVNQKN